MKEERPEDSIGYRQSELGYNSSPISCTVATREELRLCYVLERMTRPQQAQYTNRIAEKVLLQSIKDSEMRRDTLEGDDTCSARCQRLDFTNV
jgi:hypothetical protein